MRGGPTHPGIVLQLNLRGKREREPKWGRRSGEPGRGIYTGFGQMERDRGGVVVGLVVEDDLWTSPEGRRKVGTRDRWDGSDKRTLLKDLVRSLVQWEGTTVVRSRVGDESLRLDVVDRGRPERLVRTSGPQVRSLEERHGGCVTCTRPKFRKRKRQGKRTLQEGSPVCVVCNDS